MTRELPLISLYTGAGGLDLGLEAAGFRTAVALEMDAHCCKTLRHNRPEWPLLEGPIADFSSRNILRSAGLRKSQAALLVGGPPCQPFSKSSYWSTGDTRRLNDPRADTLTQYMRVLKDTLPEAFLLENVHGLLYKRKDEGITHLLELTDKINEETGAKYKVTFRMLKAADYGVPQLRERVFLIGHREGGTFKFPPPSFAAASPNGQLDILGILPYRTAWDVLGDLPEDLPDEDLKIRGKWADLVPSIPESENYLWHTDRKGGKPLFGWRTRYWGFLLKLGKNLPAWTIQATPGPAIGPFHWKSRRLSVRETLRIQTFPDNFEVLGSRVEIQRQIGNAVPSLLTEVLGQEIRRQLFGHKTTGKLKLLPPARSPAPPRERLRPVAKKFLHLMGNHVPHPGTGKGPRAFADKS